MTILEDRINKSEARNKIYNPVFLNNFQIVTMTRKEHQNQKKLEEESLEIWTKINAEMSEHDVLACMSALIDLTCVAYGEIFKE